MPIAASNMVMGTFTVPASLPASVNVNLGFIPSKVELIDKTALLSMAGGPPVINPGSNYLAYKWTWNTDFASGLTLVEAMAPAASVTNVPVVSTGIVTSNGISTYDGSQSIKLGSLVTGGALSKANPAQLTSTAHGLQTGDQILITGPFTASTAMNQLGGMIFSVTVTGANTVTIPINTNTANFTATTVTSWRKVIVGPFYYPSRYWITNITAANPCVITTSQNHGLTVGQQVRVRCPSVMGMTQINNQMATITAVTSTTVTLGSLDSSAYTAFAWPATTSVPFTPAFLIPIGSGPTAFSAQNVSYNYDVLDDATAYNQFQGFTVGTNILATASSTVLGVAASDVISYTAWRSDQ